MNQDEFISFFKPYAKNVDQANSLGFWKLSDLLITEIIKKHIPTDLSKDNRILDAGGGTGRWITELAKIYDANFTLYDLSEDMLAKAKQNIKDAELEDRVEILQGDLTDMSAVEDESVDYIVSIYSPISFVEQKDEAAKELFKKLKKGGVMLMMGHGYHNAIASKINNYQAPAEELKTLDSEMLVKWAPHVPVLSTFSKESMEGLLEGAGFSSVDTYGVPVFIQPGPEDFNPSNTEKSKISKALEDPDFFQTVFEIEMQHNSKPTISNRGMNMFSVVKKA